MELRLQGITKFFGTQAALQNVTLDLTPGIIAVMGPNGSGKTTLLRCLASLMQPERGQLWFNGLEYRKNLATLRRHIGYLPQELDVPPHLTSRQLLVYLAVLKNASTDNQVDRLLAALSLEKIANVPFSRLSGGQIRLVGIAQAFLGQPDLLLLDELTRGLDVEERAMVFAFMRKSAPGRLILYSTHHPTDAEQVADGIVILRQGQVIFSGEIRDLYQKVKALPLSLDTPIQESSQESERICRGDEIIEKRRSQLIHVDESSSHSASPQLTIEEAYLRLLRESQNAGYG